MQFLYEQDMLKELAAYGGWNTSSNTLGTVLSHLCAWNAAEKLGRLSEAVRDASEEFLFFRYLEDWGYMAEVRRDVTDHLTDIDPALNRLDLRDKEPVVREIVKKRLEEFQAKYFPCNQASRSLRKCSESLWKHAITNRNYWKRIY